MIPRVLLLCVCLLTASLHSAQVSANFWDWDDREYHIDTEVIAANPQTGECFWPTA
jgi:hypothetical protein